MLEPAIKYKAELERLQYDTWFNDKYMYYYTSAYYPFEIDDNTQYKHQFVSVINGEIIGFISYNISREDNSVPFLSIINFTDNIAFGKDLGQALKDIFEKYRFRKLSFSVNIGNPIEKSYDMMIKKYSGRIVGVMKEDIMLINGTYCDVKLYEILASDYFKTKSSGDILPGGKVPIYVKNNIFNIDKK